MHKGLLVVASRVSIDGVLRKQPLAAMPGRQTKLEFDLACGVQVGLRYGRS
jgi:hypothetical protein